MTKRVMTLTEAMRCRDLLAEHLVRTAAKNEAGVHTWRYEKGWHDNAVAKAIAPDLNRQSVARVRMELFGPIMGAVKEKPKPNGVRPRVSDERVGCLEMRMDAVERILRHLCVGLGVPYDVNTGT
jgi:hypothetical protein